MGYHEGYMWGIQVMAHLIIVPFYMAWIITRGISIPGNPFFLGQNME